MAEVLAVVGRSGAGKTTLIENVLEILKARGLRLATIKTTHHSVHEDSAGTDTFRHAEAGSECRALMGVDFCTIWGAQPELDPLIELLSPGRDVIIVEGGKSSSLRKVELRHGESILSEPPWLTLNRGQEQNLVRAITELLWEEPELRCHTICQKDALYQEERTLRNQVLLRPIGLPDHAWEQRDHASWHIIANFKESVVGCVVLWPSDESPTDAQLMQMAVRPDWQGRGVGKQLVEKLTALARQEGLGKVWCHSRADVVPFYGRLGFEASGPPFDEVGLAHQKMWLDLSTLK